MFGNKTDTKVLGYYIAFVFLLMFIFAGVAWFERVNSDAGYYIFKTINRQFFYIEHGRFVLAFAEILPLCGIWMNASLKTVLILYSFNHILFFAILTWICWRISGKINGSLVTTLLTFCGLRESLYTPQFELYYGLGFLVLFMVCFQTWTMEKSPGFIQISALLILAILALTSHPTAAMLFLLSILFNELLLRRFSLKIWISVFILFVAYIFWKKGTVSEYESSKFAWYWFNIKSGNILHIFSFEKIYHGLLLLSKYYFDVLILFIGISVMYLFQKKYKLVLLYAAGFGFFLLSVWGIYSPGDAIDRYLEQIYYPAVFAVFIPLLFMEKMQLKFIAIFGFILCYRFILITSSYSRFSDRTASMDAQIRTTSIMKGQRFIVWKNEMTETAYNAANWSYGFETMMRSTVLLNRTITITKDEDIYAEEKNEFLNPDEYLFTLWAREKTTELNQKYFKLDNGFYLQLFPENHHPPDRLH